MSSLRKFFQTKGVQISLFRGYMAMYIWAWTVNAIYFYFFHGSPHLALACLVGVPISIAATILHEQGFKFLATLFRTLTAVGIIGYISWNTGGANSPILFWLLSVVLGATLVFGLKAGFVVFAVSLGLTIGLIFLSAEPTHLTPFTVLALLPYMLVIGVVFVKITNHYMNRYLSEKEKVQESLQHLQNIYDNIPQKIAIFGRDAPTGEVLLKGRSRLLSEDVPGILRELGFADDEIQREHQRIAHALQGGREHFDAHDFTMRVQGPEAVFSLKWSPVFDQQGLVKQMILTAEDVTKIEAERRSSSEKALRRFLPPHLVKDIIEGRVTLDDTPRSQHVTVLFSDIVDFTRLSEQLGPEKIALVLNEYRETMIDVVFAHQGTIDKFIGDAIMILFGAPQSITQNQQVELATQCALAMQAALQKLNQRWQGEGLKPLFMRIGIHTGSAIVGTFGNALRSEYTAIGSTVNMASRIEGAALPGSIFISLEVKAYLQSHHWIAAGQFHLKGLGNVELFQMDQAPLSRAV